MAGFRLVEAVVVSGREFSAAVLGRIGALVRERPELTRAALAREVCHWLNWKQPNGHWCDSSCRIALLKLSRRGVLELPEPRRQLVRSAPPLPPAAVGLVPTPIGGTVRDLHGLVLVRVTDHRSPEALLWKGMIAAHHYCGYQPLVGAQIRYLIGSQRGWLGALGFSAAACHLGDRDRFIGWSPRARSVHRHEVVANSRFLLLPWVQVPHLASKVLALACRQLPSDWQATYGYQPLLLETYVEEERFAGTCYRAANWLHVGRTTGRGRGDSDRTGQVPIKAIYLYPLHPNWQKRLCCEPMGRARPLPAESGDGADWAQREFGDVSMGDRRLQRRLVTLAQDFYARPQAHLPQACGTRAKTKAAYRLLDHDQLSLPQLLTAHYASTVERMRSHAVVLAVQDTTVLNYSSHLDTEGLGPIHTKQEGAQGLLLHDTLAFTPEGVPLGLLDAQLWARPPANFGSAKQRKQLPIEQKESQKWLASFTAAAAAQRELAHTQVVSIGDREADVYELFELVLSRADHPHLLIRAVQDRLVDDGHQRLWETVESQPVVGYQTVQASRRRGIAARVAHLAVRFAEVFVLPPKKDRRGRLPVRVWAVLAREEEPPPEVKPLEWMLLTTLPVRTAEEAAEKLVWYTRRWGIEVYHKTLKSGCRIEQRQLATARRLENCLALDMVVAWRILHLTHLGRQAPDLPCTVYFDDIQWQALHGFLHRNPIPPPQPPTLRQAIRMVASLGGFLGRKGDGEPGTQTIWLGLQRLDDIATAWAVFSKLARPP